MKKHRNDNTTGYDQGQNMERRLIKTAQNLRTDQYKRINIDNIGLIYHNIGQE